MLDSMDSALQVASVLKFLLNFLCKLPRKLVLKLVHFTKGFIRRCFNPKSWVPFIAFPGRLLTIWGLWRNRKTFQRVQKAENSFPGIDLDVRQDHDQPRDQPIACTNIPASARRPGPYPSGAAASPAARSQDGQPMANPSSVFDAGSNRSCTGLNIFSHASNRLSIIQSHSPGASLHPLLHPKGNPKAAHRQFGCGPSTDHLEVTSHPHISVVPTGVYGHHRGQSSISVAVQIENLSTESLPHNQSDGSPTPQEKPYSIGFPTLYSSPSSKPSNLPEESPEPTSTASLAVLVPDFELPEGRCLQMITSEQVPRYTKSVTV